MSLPKFNEASYAHFVTTKAFGNKKLFKDDKCCEILVEDISFYRSKFGFKLVGYCIMPDHLHLIAWWDVDAIKDLTISKIMQSIKGHSARQIVDHLHHAGRRGPLTSSQTNRLGQGTQATRMGEYPKRRMSEQKYRIWQHDFYDFNIYSDKKLREKLNYIHQNPVRAGLCSKPEDWPWSSYRFYELGEEGMIRMDMIE